MPDIESGESGIGVVEFISPLDAEFSLSKDKMMLA